MNQLCILKHITCQYTVIPSANGLHGKNRKNLGCRNDKQQCSQEEQMFQDFFSAVFSLLFLLKYTEVQELCFQVTNDENHVLSRVHRTPQSSTESGKEINMRRKKSLLVLCYNFSVERYIIVFIYEPSVYTSEICHDKLGQQGLYVTTSTVQPH